MNVYLGRYSDSVQAGLLDGRVHSSRGKVQRIQTRLLADNLLIRLFLLRLIRFVDPILQNTLACIQYVRDLVNSTCLFIGRPILH
jgi:hypothetical protein